MHILGTECYAHIQNCKKLDARCRKGVFVQYDGQSRVYLVYFPDQKEVIRERCVKFVDKHEVQMPRSDVHESDIDDDLPTHITRSLTSSGGC